MRTWQHHWETWAGRNLGLERWGFAFGAGQARRLSRSDHALSDSATNLPMAIRPIGTHFRVGRGLDERAIDKFVYANDMALHF
jgi:hypothetical protein